MKAVAGAATAYQAGIDLWVHRGRRVALGGVVLQQT